MGKFRFWVVFLCLVSISDLQAQLNRYVVHFYDKKGTPYFLSQPQDFLSQRALDRRKKNNVQITERDLPVNPAYLSGLAALGADVFYSSRWMNLALVQADARLVARLDSLPFVSKVEYVAPGVKLQARELIDDKWLSTAVSDAVTASTDSQNSMLSIDHMHQQNFEGEGVLIAVFDAGFMGVDSAPFFQHLQANHQLKDHFNFIKNSAEVYITHDHGTKVLSALAARLLAIEGTDTTYFLGSAPGADFALYLTEDIYGEYRIEEYNWLFAAERADSLGADIINSSLGYSTFSDHNMSYTPADMDGQTAICTRAANVASERGILVVSSAGNQGRGGWQKITAPADSPYVLSVGAITSNGSLAGFSSIGPSSDGRIKPEVVALGQAVTVGTSSGKISTANGTSFSAPIVSGLVAGLLQAFPDKSRLEIFQDILRSASRSSAPDTLLGYGIPDFLKALNNPLLATEPETTPDIHVFPNPVAGTQIHVRIQELKTEGPLQLSLLNLNGRVLSFKTYTILNKDNVYSIEHDEIAPGAYFLRIAGSGFEHTIKLIKL